MSLMNKMSIIFMFATAFAMSACDGVDEVVDNVTPAPECDAENFKAACLSDGVTLQTCADGKLVTTTCTNVCENGACVDKTTPDPDPDPDPDHECEASLLQCSTDGSAIETCVDGKIVTTSCGDFGCKDSKCLECAEDTAPFCADNNTLQKCVDGKIVTSTCEGGCVKEDGACKDISCAFETQCSDDGKSLKTCNKGEITEKECDWKCENNACVMPQLGGACQCTGDDCTKTLTGKEFKELLSVQYGNIKISNLDHWQNGMMNLIVPGGFNFAIRDSDNIKFPNFFSESITGCDDLKAFVPEGMTLGCFRDAEISTTEESSFVTVAKGFTNVGKVLLEYFSKTDVSKVDIAGILDLLVNSLTDGIPFKATNGYCMYSTIDISGKLKEAELNKTSPSDITAGNILKTSVLEEGKIKEINTGDHSKAKNAECPDGSVKFTYDVKVDKPRVGTIDVGFDMCLKACEQDSDCRTDDGYKCVEIPNGVGENATKQKACFDESNITYFTDMTKEFESKVTPLTEEDKKAEEDKEEETDKESSTESSGSGGDASGSTDSSSSGSSEGSSTNDSANSGNSSDGTSDDSKSSSSDNHGATESDQTSSSGGSSSTSGNEKSAQSKDTEGVEVEEETTEEKIAK